MSVRPFVQMTATAKKCLSLGNFDKAGPNLQNKYLKRWITTDYIPPTSVSSLPLLALQLFVNAPHQDKTHDHCLTPAGAMSLPTDSPCR